MSISLAAIRLKSVYPSLSLTERRLADYILSHHEEIPLCSVYEIASASQVSVATVSRLVRKLDYAGLREFKVELARSSNPTADYFYEQIRPEDSDDRVVAKVFAGNISSLEETLRILDGQQLVEAVERLCTARTLLFVGIGSSGFIAQDASMRFSFLGFASRAFVDVNEIYFHAGAAGPGDAVIGISHSGRTTITVQALRMARENQATTIGISNYLQSPLHESSQYFFCTSFPESHVKVTALSSRIAQMCLFDVIYLLCARCKGPLENVDQLDRHLEDLLRFPERA